MAAAVACAAATGAHAGDQGGRTACIEASRTENGTTFICAAPRPAPSPPAALPAEFKIRPMESLELRFDRPHHIRTLLLSLGCNSANARRPPQGRTRVEVVADDGASLRTVLPDTGQQRIGLPRWTQATSVVVRLLPPEADMASSLCVTELSADLEEERAIEFERAACEDSGRKLAKARCLEGVIARIERESAAALRQLRVQYQGRQGLLSGLAGAQQGWKQWRDAECDLRSARFASDAGAGGEAARCRAELDEARLWQLRDLQE
ncbi:MAG: lysozyme inhibitor LprI family protein [Phenylobacterium sp.]|uniref:lysozyme inhibitor LprI family protein n=1 Tax=Phenylobacterium sp. TaxID=1871053 RepID=UPI002733B773|nr:lysozyme inhibitor LprI family protein [Phenylobacterium sp.]MDP3747009.1 lysozyme inhibitor LprI family protein [Phenylobacterium sp.]